MRWIEEPNSNRPPDRVLTVDEGESLEPAWAEYWKAILTDGNALPRGSRFKLNIDIYTRTFEKDSSGETTAKFYNSLNRQPDDIGAYVLRGEPFTLLQGKEEDDTTFGARQLIWMLDHYRRLKAALQSNDIWPLYERINSSQPLPINLATSNGWFALLPGETGFGPLPLEDQELIAGIEPTQQDPMKSLTHGVFSAPETSAIEELTAALIQYTPPHFKNIYCILREGIEEGQRALFYRIECPEFPSEDTTAVNDRIHRAATLFVQQQAPQPGTFPGIAIRLSLQPDGAWKLSVESLTG